MIKNDKNTQKEAARKALEILGGRAQMKYICLVAAHLIGHNTQAKDVKNNVRREIYTNSTLFQRVPDMPDGWWELVSYQEEIAVRDNEIEALKAEVERLKKVPTEDDFVKKLIKATKTQFRFKRNEADAVRQVMDKLGRSDADADLTAWMEGRENKASVSIGKLEVRQGGTNIDSNYGPNIEHNGGTLSLPEMKI